MVSVKENMRKAREAQKTKHGTNYSEVMAERARKSNEAQRLKYGDKLDEERTRRAKLGHQTRKKHLKDAEPFSKLEEQE